MVGVKWVSHTSGMQHKVLPDSHKAVLLTHLERSSATHCICSSLWQSGHCKTWLLPINSRPHCVLHTVLAHLLGTAALCNGAQQPMAVNALQNAHLLGTAKCCSAAEVRQPVAISALQNLVQCRQSSPMAAACTYKMKFMARQSLLACGHGVQLRRGAAALALAVVANVVPLVLDLHQTLPSQIRVCELAVPACKRPKGNSRAST